MFKRLSLRLTLLTVILLVVLYSITSLALYGIIRGFVTRGIDFTLRQAAYRVADTAVLTGIPSFASTGSPEINFVLADNGVYTSIADPDLANALEKRLSRSADRPVFFNFAHEGEHYRVFELPISPGSGGPAYVATVLDDSQTVRALSDLRSVIVIVGLFGICGATLVGFILSERMLKPIRRAFQRQLEFVADASHELRTPLAVIQSNLGIVMEHTDQTVEQNLEWLNNAHGEARRLAKLVQDLLTLARSDSERMPVDRRPVALNDLLDRIHDLYETIAEMRGIELAVRADEPLVVLGDRDRLHQLLVILIDNAMKFTDAGGKVEIAATRTRNQAVVSVRDTGIGIAKEHLDRVFDRFYTVDTARSRHGETKGTGLGLSIAKWIVEAHGGKISIASEGVGKGTTVRVELPLMPRKAAPPGEEDVKAKGEA
ncbi:sensor histidine kinase [Alicyclobacillus vulcanalis]|uniref:histidine kinase n=1 Tax=Alicyclobacillus vulcanalis TaxID=252246 RepID=A0A1N7K8J4_9BACL|nr:ATP-binding protein [Alicyclobacillus vulcanalis]SIS57892.1 His Kinase A (phospho-acceptor) domain-containing protein [Alicyclobacillus vulcanalis]